MACLVLLETRSKSRQDDVSKTTVTAAGDDANRQNTKQNKIPFALKQAKVKLLQLKSDIDLNNKPLYFRGAHKTQVGNKILYST